MPSNVIHHAVVLVYIINTIDGSPASYRQSFYHLRENIAVFSEILSICVSFLLNIVKSCAFKIFFYEINLRLGYIRLD